MFLGQIEPFKSQGLPTNTIIHKKVTGCGATTSELEFPRNSIIIEPNVPVITGKCNKINKGKRKNKIVQGVYEGITVDMIKDYLNNRKGYKKIMTTPESCWKVAEAIGESMCKDYFLLFDECEKAIQDIDFRDSIVDPIDAFFKFDNKAFVSATPIIPSDPRFTEFTHLTIEPDYVFSEEIHVFTTNNVTMQLKQLLDFFEATDLTDRKFFIFLKSTKRIRSIIKRLGLTDCAVYCSEDSARELSINGIEHTYDKINDKFAKYNFLTSRFFSAVDIDYEDYNCNPIIIMVTDVIAVQHTMIDPNTEAIQICGRFRQPNDDSIVVTKDIVHLSNYDSKLTNFNRTEIDSILKDKKTLHEFITKYQPTSDIEYFNKFIDEIISLNGFKYFLRETDGELNHFMVDNFVNEEQVKGFYRTGSSLRSQYKNSQHFSVHGDSEYVFYSVTDDELLQYHDQTVTTTLNEFVSTKVKEIMEYGHTGIGLQLNLEFLRSTYPKQMKVIDNYGLESAKTLDYDIDSIAKQLEEAKGLKALIPIIKYVQREFTKTKYTSAEIEALLKKGIAETGLNDLKPTIQLLRNAVLLSDRCNVKKDNNGNWIKGYEVIEFIQKF